MPGNGKGPKGPSFEVITGTDGDDILDASDRVLPVHMNGGDGHDDLTGSAQDDSIRAGDGNDTVRGGEGDDELFGNDGIDTAVFAGSILDFTWTPGRGNSLIVSDANPGDGDQGTDRLKQFEFLQFDDFILDLGGNNAPLVLAPDQTATEDAPAALHVDAFDFDGDPLSVSGLGFTGGGSLTLDPAPVALAPLMGSGARFTLNFDPGDAYDHLALGESAVETVSFTVSDGQGGLRVVSFDLTIEGRNDTPLAGNGEINAAESAGLIQLDLNTLVSDVDLTDVLTITGAAQTTGDPLSFSVTNGVLSIDSGQFEHLSHGQVASYVFSYTVADDSGAANDSATGTVTLNVTGENDAPVATNGSFDLVDSTGIFEIDITTLVSDADLADVISVTGLSVVSGGELAYSVVGGSIFIDTGQFADLDAGENLSFLLDYTVDDGSGAPDSGAGAQITVNVEGVLNPPEARLLDFEDLGPLVGPVPFGASGGMQFTNAAYVRGTALGGDGRGGAPNGFQNGVTSGDHAILSLNGTDLTMRSYDPARNFDLVSAQLTGGWRDGLTVTISGYDDGVLIGSQVVVVDTSGPLGVVFDDSVFDSVDQVVFSTSGGVNAGLGGFGDNVVIDDILIVA